MNICLYDRDYGYYTTKEHIFGAKGDFITSPEISQMFGEIIGIWVFKIIEGFKFPEKIDIVEIGAGRGFMMSDIIRTLLTFKRNHELNFYIVEKSDKLAKIQQDNITNMLMKEKIFMVYNHDKVKNIFYSFADFIFLFIKKKFEFHRKNK
jgi:NADH dehydrogenase [ubiquinone] 1 alpha subcomplex assembly factor 7